MSVERLLSLILILSLVVLTGCSSCRSDEQTMHREADARIQALSEVLPTRADAAVVVPEIGKMRVAVDHTMERVSQFQPQIRMVEQQLSRELGLRITEEQSWRDSGIDPNGSLIVAIIGNRPVIATFIEDRQKFESRFVERLRRSGDTEGPVRTESVGGQSFKVSGDGIHNEFAWFYRDSMVFLAMPPFDALGAFKEGTALSVANSVAQTTPENSLGRSEAFLSYREGLGELAISLYVDAEKYFRRPESHRIAGGLESILESLVSWSRSNAEGAGIGLDADERTILLQAFVGGDEDLIKEAQAAFGTTATVDWGSMLTTNTVFAVRTGFDLAKAMETYMSSLPDDQRRRLARQINQLGRNYQLDMEEEVFRAFSGQSLTVFYGLGGDIARLLQGLNSAEPLDIVRTILANSGLLVGLHFVEEEKLEKLLSRADELTADFVVRRPLIYHGEQKSDVEVMEPRSLSLFPARLFRRNDVVTIAAAGIGENAAYDYMTGQRSEGKLADSETYLLGQDFAIKEGMNGIYVNFENLRQTIRRIPMVGGFANQLQPLHELLISAEVSDKGFYLSAELEFTEPLGSDQE